MLIKQPTLALILLTTFSPAFSSDSDSDDHLGTYDYSNPLELRNRAARELIFKIDKASKEEPDKVPALCEELKAYAPDGCPRKGLATISPLGHAVALGVCPAITALLDAGADINYIDPNGHSALDFYQYNKRPEPWLDYDDFLEPSTYEALKIIVDHPSLNPDLLAKRNSWLGYSLLEDSPYKKINAHLAPIMALHRRWHRSDRAAWMQAVTAGALSIADAPHAHTDELDETKKPRVTP